MRSIADAFRSPGDILFLGRCGPLADACHVGALLASFGPLSMWAMGSRPIYSITQFYHEALGGLCHIFPFIQPVSYHRISKKKQHVKETQFVISWAFKSSRYKVSLDNSHQSSRVKKYKYLLNS
ncbi:unnamed protein product [Cuscuta epithymum]|uniref:Uncharacterized protein n=1 Tax=Cuscuta epithymum TaxID=186058 RepID=A0AAV0E619_9ASTE|nr:unnamed protein product [Cuscuta epithymum]